MGRQSKELYATILVILCRLLNYLLKLEYSKSCLKYSAHFEELLMTGHMARTATYLKYSVLYMCFNYLVGET